MTDLREVLGSALTGEPTATTIDPYAALAAGQARRRTRRHRWLAGGATAAVVVAVGAVVALPRLGSSPVVAVPATSSNEVGWVGAEGTGSGSLDVTATRAALAAAGVDVPGLLGLPAAGPVALYPAVKGGSLQLAYRTAGQSPAEVHVVLGTPVPMICPYIAPRPAPTQWAATSGGLRPSAQWMCGPGPDVVTTVAAHGSLDRTVMTHGSKGGVLHLTVTSPADAAAPITVTKALAVLDDLAAHLVFHDGSAVPNPRASTPTAVRLSWVTTEGTADTGPYLDTERTVARLDGMAEQVQALLGLAAAEPAEPYRGVGKFGAVQLAYRTADDVEVQVLLKGPVSLGIPACRYPLPPPAPDDWPTNPAGSRPSAPSLCGPDVAIATTVAASGRVARTVAGWGTAGGQLSVTVTSALDAPPPVSLATVRTVVDLLAGTLVFQR